jgi:hypothetical protein
MGYLIQSECDNRIAKVRELLEAKDLDLALVYYDEFNIGNGWYLTGWCPQFESGTVLVPRKGTPLNLSQSSTALLLKPVISRFSWCRMKNIRMRLSLIFRDYLQS